MYMNVCLELVLTHLFQDSYPATFLVGGCVLILGHLSKVFMHFIICILMNQLFLASLTDIHCMLQQRWKLHDLSGTTKK